MGQMAHLRNYVMEPGCEVGAVAELKEKTGRSVARRYGVPACYPTAKEMLEKEDLDAIVASQPFDRHAILVPELLKAGKPVFIEKPLAASVQAGERIQKAVQDSGTFVMVGYHKRSDPATEFVRRRLEALAASGEIGEMTYVRITMPAGDWVAGGFDGRIDEGDEAGDLGRDPPPPDMDAQAHAEYLRFVNYYIHQVNLMRHLLGEGYEPVYADPEGRLLVGRSVSGKTCTIEMSPYTTTVDWQELALVCFERGWVELSLPAPLASNRSGQARVYRDPGGGVTPMLECPTLPWVHAMRQQAANFIAAVRGERPPVTDAAESLEDLRVARAYLDLLLGGR